MRNRVIAALLAGVAATPAIAQDEALSPPPSSMSGFRVEALAGWDHTEILGDDDGGILHGLGIGYDFQTDRAVLSIEAEANDSTNNGCLTGIVNANDRFCVNTGRDLCCTAATELDLSIRPCCTAATSS